MVPDGLTDLQNLKVYELLRSDKDSLTTTTKQLATGIVFAAIALTVFEGALRKWVIGSGFQIASYAAYFSKDLAFATLLFVPARGAVSLQCDVFRRWMMPGCFLLVCGALTSSAYDFNLGGAVLTLRALIFLPLVALLAAQRLRGVSLRSLTLFVGLLTILNFALGVIQNRSPSDAFLNRYASDTLDITTLESGVRATGTFSYISGMGVISTVGIWAGMVYMSLGRNMRQQMFGWAVVVSGFGCGLASVSRGPVFTGLIMVLGWLVFGGQWAARKSGSVVAGFLVVALVMLGDLTVTFFDLSQGFLLRAQTAEDTVRERSWGPISDALIAIETAPFGNGLGTEQVGGSYYSRGEMSFTTFETQFARLVLETSVLGLLGFVVMCTGAVYALQVAKERNGVDGGSAALLATQFFIASMLATNVVFNHVASAFVWIIFTTVLADGDKSSIGTASLI